MIPAGYPISFKPMDVKELTGYSSQELEGLGDEKLTAALLSIDNTVFSKYADAIGKPDRDDEQLNIIRNYRLFLNDVYDKARTSSNQLHSVKITCERADWRWASKERCLTGDLDYIFSTTASPK